MMNPAGLDRIVNELARNSSQKALQELYIMYYRKLFRYVGFYVRDEEVVAEIVSDVFFAIWEKRVELTDVRNFNAFIYRIAKYKALNYLRGRNLNTIDINDIPFDLFAGTISSPEDNLISSETVENINNAIEQLPSKCKLAFKLVREDGMSYKEASELLASQRKPLKFTYIGLCGKSGKYSLWAGAEPSSNNCKKIGESE